MEDDSFDFWGTPPIGVDLRFFGRVLDALGGSHNSEYVATHNRWPFKTCAHETKKKIRFSAQLFFMNGFLWNIGKTSQEGNPGVQKKVVSQQCLCQEEKYPMASENPICPIKNSVQPESLFGLQPKQSKHIC